MSTCIRCGKSLDRNSTVGCTGCLSEYLDRVGDGTYPGGFTAWAEENPKQLGLVQRILNWFK